MTVVRTFTPEVRLKKLLQEPGGITAQTALERADNNVESIRESCLEAVDVKIEALSEAANAQQPDWVAKVYKSANEVFAEAGTFGLIELSAAAHSLCTLTASKEKAPLAAVRVHIDAMRVLRKPELAGDKVARGAVLAGLRGMTAKLAKA